MGMGMCIGMDLDIGVCMGNCMDVGMVRGMGCMKARELGEDNSNEVKMDMGENRKRKVVCWTMGGIEGKGRKISKGEDSKNIDMGSDLGMAMNMDMIMCSGTGEKKNPLVEPCFFQWSFEFVGFWEYGEVSLGNC